MLEVDIIKNIMNTLVSKRVKGELLENSVKGLKEKIWKIMATNKQMLAQIKHIKEGLTDQSEKESK